MRLPQLKARDLVRILHQLGFVYVRQKGSHAFYKHPMTKHSTLVPIHPGEDIGRGLLRAIMNEANISREDFEKLFRR